MAADNFLAKVVLLVLAPAVVHALGIGLQNNVNQGYGDESFVRNYLFMAAPHLLMVCLAAVSILRRGTLLQTLVGLNLVLVSFTIYVHWHVPSRETGLAWVLYYPLCALFLVAYGIFKFAVGRRSA
ncbi:MULTISPECIES: hypothetical protein [Pseudomonas]|uniref:hypothetical protein n=1 Tax=Pseudomonas TaxID=286 RepID=UPI0023D85F7B|nr:hypothetical protein [Pseudomonas sp. PSE14]WEJ74643.1 hypothetical protein O6P39_12450 [Pseudomonas sp. PSE14]